MSEVIDTTRALLRMFEQSGYGDLHVRVGNYEMFVSRAAGRTDPLRAGGAKSAALVAAPRTSVTVSAPHIASLVSSLPVGSFVGAGDMVARIALLDEQIDIPAPQPGMVEAVLAEPGALLEYDTPILSLIAA